MAGQFAVDKGQLENVFRALEKTKNNDGRNIRIALTRCAEIVLARSQGYVPVDTGRLKASGKVVSNTSQGLHTRVAVVYEAPYAIYVHERTDIPHKPPTCAKYLERAARELRGTCMSLVRRQLQVEGN